jgi:hypothetical protein
MQPAHTDFAEDVFPIEVTWFELTGCGMAAIRNPQSAAYAEAALGEVEAVTDRAANAVVRNPPDELAIDTPLKDKILHQTADVVVCERGAYGGLEAETAPEAASDVVFAAAFPHLELTSGTDAAFTGIEAEHDFAEGEEIVFAGGARLDVKGGHGVDSRFSLEPRRMTSEIKFRIPKSKVE